MTVRLDKILSGANGNIESVHVYADDNANTDHAEFENGLLVTLGAQAEDGREVHQAFPTKASDAGDEVLIVVSPELQYDESAMLKDFRNAPGAIARAYRLSDGDVITITDNLLPDELSIGDVLVAGEDGKLVPSSGAGDYKVTFKVIEDAGYELDADYIEPLTATVLKVERDVKSIA